VHLVHKVSSLPRSAWVLFAGTFINKLGNFLAIFVVLFLTAKGYSPTVAGIGLGIIGAGNFVGNGIGGTITDHLGRRGTIAVSMFGSGLCTVMVPVVGNIVLLFLLVGVIGIFAQLYRPAAAAFLLDVVSDDRRTTAFAVYRLAINLGMAAGPVLGGILSGYSYNWIFMVDALSSIVYGVVALTMLPETAPPATEPGQERLSRSSAGYRAVLGDRPFVLFLLAMVAATYVYAQATATLPLQVRDYHLPNSFYGLLLSINAAVVVALELPLTHVLETRPMKTLIAAGLVLLGVGFGLNALGPSRAVLVLSVLIWTFAEMIIMPLASAYPGRYSPAALRGRYQAAFGQAQTLATGIGPVIGGFLYSRGHSLNWLACAVVAGIGVPFILAARPQTEKSVTSEISAG
jgi:MFS family permease